MKSLKYLHFSLLEWQESTKIASEKAPLFGFLNL